MKYRTYNAHITVPVIKGEGDLFDRVWKKVMEVELILRELAIELGKEEHKVAVGRGFNQPEIEKIAFDEWEDEE